MLAAVIEGPGAVVVRDTAPPQPAGLAMVRATQAGVCGTDRAVAAEGVPARPPRVLGREMTGLVEALVPGGAVSVRLADRLPTYAAYLRKLTIRCPRASRPADFDTAIRLCAERRVALAPLITGRFPLGEVAQELAACARPEQLKIVLDVAGP